MAAEEKSVSPVEATLTSPPPADSTTGVLPARHWALAEQEHDDDEDTESAASATTSITSSIRQYRTIHGRRFHSEIGNAEYWGANDDKQNESMILNHHSMTLAMGGRLFNAPLDKDKIQAVLDIGTGTGIWAIDFADEFPQVQVIGTDISPIQPTWSLPNLKFEIEDCTSEWTFPPDSFDYVHMRWMAGSIADWTAFFTEAYKALKPGGWLESHEPASEIGSDDGTVKRDSALGQWGQIFVEGGKKIGRTFELYNKGLQRKIMEEVGFTNIGEVEMKSPIGSWPEDPKLKERGIIQQMSFETDIEGYILFISGTIGWSREEVEVYIGHLRREMRSGESHPLFKQKAVWGRKPY